jgi:hypothetical protein
MAFESALPHSNHAISGLIKFRAALAGLIEQYQQRLEQRFIDLEKIDSAIKLIDPGVDLTTIRPKRVRAAREEIGATIFILDTLRVAEHPLTARELGLKLVDARGHSADDAALVGKAVTQVSAALQQLRKQGTVGATKVGVGPQVWRLTD